MRHKWEILSELSEIRSLKKQIEDRVQSAWQPVYTSPDSPTEEPLEITPEYLDFVIEQMAHALIKDTAGKNPLLIGLMDGARFFADKLLAAIERYNQSETLENRFYFDYVTMQTSSYTGIESGKLSMAPPKEPVGGREIVLIDDVMDTGKTLNGVINYMIGRGAEPIQYQFKLMSDYSEYSTETGVIYLSETGDYMVREINGNLHTGKLFGVDLVELNKKITDQVFQEDVLAFTFEKGHTSKIRTMAMADKIIPERVIQPTYYGVRVDGKAFLIGAGMDYLTSRFRLYPGIKAVDLSTIATKEEKAILAKEDGLHQELVACQSAHQAEKIISQSSSCAFLAPPTTPRTAANHADITESVSLA